MLEGLAVRARLANIAGITFGGKRNLYDALGYEREPTQLQYRSRYRRNEIANRIVKSAPKATWRGGAQILEDEELETVTAFEQACIDLEQKLKFWSQLYKADVLSRIGRYGVLLIGGPGRFQDPMPPLKGLDDILYLTPFAEEEARIQFYEIDPSQPRFGLPVMYLIKRTNLVDPTAINQASVGRPVHWSRVIHISEGLLDDRVQGEPVLECVWNRLDDLEKVAGAGPEAFWRRADGGTKLSIDPTLELDELAMKDLQKQIDEYEHQQRKSLVLRGATFEPVNATVTSIKADVDSLISLISAGCGIPQRVLMGSEQGKLAAKQDRAAWDNQITDRQNDYAGPLIVRPFIDRLIGIGALPAPTNGPNEYEVKWSELQTMDDDQRAVVASQWAGLNKPGGPIVVTPNEIREKVLKLPPLEEVTPDGNDPNAQWLSTPTPSNAVKSGAETPDPNEPGLAYDQTKRSTDGSLAGPDAPATMPDDANQIIAVMKGGRNRYAHVHQAADRFRRSTKQERIRRLQKRRAVHLPSGS
jgi:hypothetical protein